MYVHLPRSALGRDYNMYIGTRASNPDGQLQRAYIAGG